MIFIRNLLIFMCDLSRIVKKQLFLAKTYQFLLINKVNKRRQLALIKAIITPNKE